MQKILCIRIIFILQLHKICFWGFVDTNYLFLYDEYILLAFSQFIYFICRKADLLC